MPRANMTLPQAVARERAWREIEEQDERLTRENEERVLRAKMRQVVEALNEAERKVLTSLLLAEEYD